MAKPKARVGSAAIAGMLGVNAAATGPADRAPSGQGGAPEGEGAHPVRDRVESGVARADNALVLDPRRVVRRGRYVRPFTEDDRFRDLLVAIEESGNTIHVPILVRVEGPPGAVEYVLVDGTHRLEAALRLGISIPAVNLGRITADRALAIQAMANEVRASMHVVDQVSYVLALLGQGLSREAVQRTAGFSAGRVSELVSIGMLIAGLSEADRERARRARRVTHRALRALKATSPDADAFRRGVMALVAASEADVMGSVDLESFGDELADAFPRPAAGGAGRAGGPGGQLGATSYQIPVSVERAAARRGRTAATPGGVTFAQGRNARGTSVTFRIAWRARAIRAEPELFLEQVRDLLQVIATEATTYYESARSGAGEKTRRKRRGGGVAAASDAWRTAIARDEAELSAAEARVADGRADAPPGDDNPMPVPPSQRRPGDAGPAISPRLLAGLSIPMLAERLKRRPASYQQLESHVSDVERQADDARRRVRELVDAEESERQGGVGGVGGVGAPERRASPEQG